MAKETITRLTDDLDGSGATTTVRFSWEGVGYEIDLSAGNAQSFQAAVEPYLMAGRRVSRTVKRSPRRRGTNADSRVGVFGPGAGLKLERRVTFRPAW